MSAVNDSNSGNQIHPLFLNGGFIRDQELNDLVQQVMGDPNLMNGTVEINLDGDLNGRALTASPSSFLMSLIDTVVVYILKTWHNVCLFFSPSYKEKFNKAAELISKKSDDIEKTDQIYKELLNAHSLEITKGLMDLKKEGHVSTALKEILSKSVDGQEALLDSAEESLSEAQALKEHEESIAQTPFKTKFEAALNTYWRLAPKSAGDYLASFLPTRHTKRLNVAKEKLDAVVSEIRQVFGEDAIQIKDQLPVLQEEKIAGRINEAKERLPALSEKVITLEDKVAALKAGIEKTEARLLKLENTVVGQVGKEVKLTPQQQMLEDIREKAHPEIAQMWEMVFSKFGPREEVIQSWKLNDDNTFEIKLARPFSMWVPDEEYNCNGGVMMLFGIETNGIIEGSLVKGEIPQEHATAVQNTLQNNTYNNKFKVQYSAPEEVAGMIFKKNASNNSGVQTYCKYGFGIWPQANTEHFLRVGNTEEGKRNIVMSGSFMGKTEGRPKSIALFREAWKNKGILLPASTNFKDFLVARA